MALSGMALESPQTTFLATGLVLPLLPPHLIDTAMIGIQYVTL